MRTILYSTFPVAQLRFDIDDAGGGGAPPVLDAPPDANGSIMDFAPPDIGDVAKFIEGKTVADPLQNPPPEIKPPAPPADPAKPPVTPPAPPAAGEPPAKQLRVELEAVKKERDDLKARFEKGDPRILEAENAVKEKAKEIADYQAKIADYQKKLDMQDPAVRAKLVELDAAYGKDADRFYRSVPEMESQKLGDLVRDYHQLPFGKAEYREKRAEFEAKVNEALGAGEGMEHRKLSATLDFIERTHDVAVERPKIEAEISQSHQKLRRESQVQTYTKELQTTRERLEMAKQIPEGLEKSNPFHPKVVLSAFVKNLPPEQAEKLTEGIDEYIELLHAGIKPRSDQDYAGMTAEQIAESNDREKDRYETARSVSVDVQRNGLISLRLMPALIKEIQRLREKVKEDGQANPPDPTGGDSGGSSGSADDVKNFQAPSLEGMNF